MLLNNWRNLKRLPQLTMIMASTATNMEINMGKKPMVRKATVRKKLQKSSLLWQRFLKEPHGMMQLLKNLIRNRIKFKPST
jgi:hypothetical protein